MITVGKEIEEAQAREKVRHKSREVKKQEQDKEKRSRSKEVGEGKNTVPEEERRDRKVVNTYQDKV